MGLPGLRSDLVAYVAAFTVEEFHEGIFGENLVVSVGLFFAVAARRQRGADKLGADDFRIELVEVGDQFVGPMLVDIAGQHDGVFDLLIVEVFQDTPPFKFVTRPLIHAVRDLGSGAAVNARHHDLLGQHIPLGGGFVQAVE